MIGRELVLSTWYGRRHLLTENVAYITWHGECIYEEKMSREINAKRSTVQECTVQGLNCLVSSD